MSHLRRVGFMFAALLAVVDASAQGRGSTGSVATWQLPDGELKQTFTYKIVNGGISIQADVYRRASAELQPIVLWIHPGALVLGSRAMLPTDQLERLLNAKVIVVAIDYRLAPETKLPAIIEDVIDAHHWVRDNAVRFRGDPTRIAVLGASAGGYLALMAGAHVQPRLRAVVSLYGYGDIAGDWYNRPSPFYLSLPRVSREQAYRAIQSRELTSGAVGDRNDYYVYLRQNGLWPREVVGVDLDGDATKSFPFSVERQVTSTYPPTLLVHGDADIDVPFQMSERMAATLEKEGVEHRLVRMKGFNHAFDVFSTYPPQGPPAGLTRSEVSEAFDTVVSFLLERLRA